MRRFLASGKDGLYLPHISRHTEMIHGIWMDGVTSMEPLNFRVFVYSELPPLDVP
jgi:hypothetical protein